MAKDPAFLFYPGDYLRDTQNLSEKPQVAYDRIMCEHMRNICEDMNNIAISKRQLDFFTKRLSDVEKEELLFVLVKKGSKYQIEWVALSIAKRKAYSNSRSDNRRNKSKKDMIDTSKHMENANEIDIETKELKENEFRIAWDLYQKKQDKKRALQIWMKLDTVEMHFCIKAIPNYVKSTPDKQFRKMFKTYLNNRSWENEIDLTNIKKEIIGYLYQCPKCKEYFVHDENVGDHNINCPECPKIERRNGLMLSDNLQYIQIIYEE